MNMEAEETNYKFSLKLLVDTSSNKVLYAEADKDFVDFLFNMLSLPIATVINLLKTTAKQEDEEMVGCIGNLYKSIEALSSKYMQPNVTKESVLNPPPVRPPNSPPSSDNTTKKFYACFSPKGFFSASEFASTFSPTSGFFSATASAFSPTSSPTSGIKSSTPIYSSSPLGGFNFGISGSKSCNYVSDVPSTVCPSCKRFMSSELKFMAPKSSDSVNVASPSSSGYVKGDVTYMVMDNLEVTTLSGEFTVALMNKSGAREVGSFVWKHVQVGPNQEVKILKASLETQAVLTTVFLERAHSFHGVAPHLNVYK